MWPLYNPYRANLKNLSMPCQLCFQQRPSESHQSYAHTLTGMESWGCTLGLWGLGFRGLGFRIRIGIMENKMDRKMENEMETGIILCHTIGIMQKKMETIGIIGVIYGFTNKTSHRACITTVATRMQQVCSYVPYRF